MTKLVAPVSHSSINSCCLPVVNQNVPPKNLNPEDTNEQASKDRPFNAFRNAKTESTKAFVLDVQRQLQKYEQIFNVRQRARKSKDLQIFEGQVEALVCDLAYQGTANPGKWLAVSFSHGTLGRCDRYRATALTQSLPDVVRLMARPEMDFIEFEKGFRSPFNPEESRQSKMRATQNLLDRMADYQLTLADFGLQKTQEVIILKDCKEDHWDLGQWLQYEDTPATTAYREELNRINKFLEEADIEYEPWDAKEKPVDASDRRLLRYFNNGSFDEGGRLFGGFWQNLKKDQRKYGILIDGSAVVTLDYGQMLPRILYGLAGVDPGFQDAYIIPGLEGYRDGVKKVLSAMLHADKKHIRKPIGTADLLPKGLKIGDIIKLITDFHEPVAQAFYAGKGMRLTLDESKILIAVLTRLMDQGITALPIHDAVIVSEDKAEHVKTVMLQVFKELIGIDALVRYD